MKPKLHRNKSDMERYSLNHEDIRRNDIQFLISLVSTTGKKAEHILLVECKISKKTEKNQQYKAH